MPCCTQGDRERNQERVCLLEEQFMFKVKRSLFFKKKMEQEPKRKVKVCLGDRETKSGRRLYSNPVDGPV